MVALNKHLTLAFILIFNIEPAFEKHYKYQHLVFSVLIVYSYYTLCTDMFEHLLIYHLIMVKWMELDRWPCSHIYAQKIGFSL